jgi:hypothetical protein
MPPLFETLALYRESDRHKSRKRHRTAYWTALCTLRQQVTPSPFTSHNRRPSPQSRSIASSTYSNGVSSALPLNSLPYD